MCACVVMGEVGSESTMRIVQFDVDTYVVCIASLEVFVRVFHTEGGVHACLPRGGCAHCDMRVT